MRWVVANFQAPFGTDGVRRRPVAPSEHTAAGNGLLAARPGMQRDIAVATQLDNANITI